MKKLLIIVAIGTLLIVLLICGFGAMVLFSYRSATNSVQQAQLQLIETQAEEGLAAPKELVSASGGLDAERYELMLAVRQKVTEVISQSEAFKLIQKMGLDGQGQPEQELSMLQRISLMSKFMKAYSDSTTALFAELSAKQMTFDEYFGLTESGYALLVIDAEQHPEKMAELSDDARTELEQLQKMFSSSPEGKANLDGYRESWLAVDSAAYASSLQLVEERKEEMRKAAMSVIIDFMLKRTQQQGKDKAAVDGDALSTGGLAIDGQLRPTA